MAKKEMQENSNIKIIEQEMERIRPKARIGAKIAWLVIFRSLSEDGLILIIIGIALYNNDISSNGMLLIKIGIIVFTILTIFFFIFLYVLICSIRVLKKYNLLKEIRDDLLKKEKEIEIENESNEDTLLRLLSEEKITVEEYKKLSEKK